MAQFDRTSSYGVGVGDAGGQGQGLGRALKGHSFRMEGRQGHGGGLDGGGEVVWK